MMEYGDYDRELQTEVIDDYESFIHAYQTEQQEIALIEERLQEYSIKNEMSTLANNCATTILEQSFHQLKFLLCLCLTLRILCLCNHFFKWMLSSNIFHILSALFGLLVVKNLFQDIYLSVFSMMITYLILTYSTMFILYMSKQKVGYLTAFLTIIFIVFCELVASNPINWHRIRGVFLVLTMKSVSIAFDLDAKKINVLPNIFEFSGYLFHVGTLLFGPWIEYSMYTDSLLSRKSLSFSWIICCAKSLCYASVCLILSSCFFSYVFFDVADPMAPFLLPVVPSFLTSAYITAISFHFSHYYIAYLSLATCLMSGTGSELPQRSSEDKKITNSSSNDLIWSKFQVTKPLAVELPTSMLNVVVGWNIPMSKWLHTYMFKTSQHLGKFSAVMLTYLASAMLHGLSFHLAVVLISLAFYTYVEYSFRRRLAVVFNCSFLEARPKPKDFENTRKPFWAYLHNIVWIVINLLHLAYLGSMFASDDEEEERSGYSMFHTLQKWSNLNYFSHWIAFACYIFYLVI